MRLSTRARYGTRALLDLAVNTKTNSTATLKEIAQRQDVSLTYLEHLVGPLIDAGLIRSIRGSKGGITLARPAREITIKDIVGVLEGPTAPVECLEHTDTCPRSGSCVTQEVWDEVGKAIDRVLESKTLEDLVERQKSKGASGEMYYI
jgi:Rrf2 family transcriptional regulator, cysteine metabolism repressor